MVQNFGTATYANELNNSSKILVLKTVRHGFFISEKKNDARVEVSIIFPNGGITMHAII